MVTSLAVALYAYVFCSAAVAEEEKRRPNIVVVMTDDQGYGDLGCHGNEIIKTPALDKFHAESVLSLIHI